MNTSAGGLPSSTHSSSLESSLGQVKKVLRKERNYNIEIRNSVFDAGLIVAIIMLISWAAVGCCYEHWLPTCMADTLATCDRFSHSHFSKVLPRIMLAQRTVLGGLTSLFTLVLSCFLATYVIIDNNIDVLSILTLV